MADALWIDEDYIMDNSPIANNTDVKVLFPNIIYCQDIFIKPLLGTDLFNVIQAEINAQSYSARVTTLLNDHLKKVLLNYVMAESTNDVAYRWMNKGIMQKNSDNSQPVNPEQLKQIQDSYRNRAEVYAQRAKNFLLENLSTYTEYNTGNTGIDDIQPISNPFKTGIFLGDANDNDCDYRKRNV
jgi:hypothetical protein